MHVPRPMIWLGRIFMAIYLCLGLAPRAHATTWAPVPASFDLVQLSCYWVSGGWSAAYHVECHPVPIAAGFQTSKACEAQRKTLKDAMQGDVEKRLVFLCVPRWL